jgi:hypothetical protein
VLGFLGPAGRGEGELEGEGDSEDVACRGCHLVFLVVFRFWESFSRRV